MFILFLFYIIIRHILVLLIPVRVPTVGPSRKAWISFLPPREDRFLLDVGSIWAYTDIWGLDKALLVGVSVVRYSV